MTIFEISVIVLLIICAAGSWRTLHVKLPKYMKKFAKGFNKAMKECSEEQISIDEDTRAINEMQHNLLSNLLGVSEELMGLLQEVKSKASKDDEKEYMSNPVLFAIYRALKHLQAYPVDTKDGIILTVNKLSEGIYNSTMEIVVRTNHEDEKESDKEDDKKKEEKKEPESAAKAE